MKIIKIVFMLLIVCLVIAGVFAWTLPADMAYRHYAKQLGPVTLSGVRGSVWQGHADGVSVMGRDLGELNWTVAKLPLLSGRVQSELRIKGADIDTSGALDRMADGSIQVRDMRFRVPAALLQPALDIPTLQLHGSITGNLQQGTLARGMLVDANGDARWSDAAVSGSADARFSDILLKFASQPDGGIAGTVADDGNGNLEISGSFQVAATGFNLEAWLSARNDDPRVKEALRYIGQPQPDGSSHLLVNGKLFKLF